MRLLFLFLFAAATLSATPAFDDAVSLYRQRKDAEARAAFESLLKAEPQNAEVPFYLGRLELRAKNLDAAIERFNSAIALDGRNATYYVELGGAYGSKAQSAGLLGKASAASKTRAAFEKAVEIDPKNFEAQSALFQYYMQAPGIMGGGFDKALAQSEVLIKLDPVRGKNAKATLLAREKRYEEAFAIYDETLQQQPDDYLALYSIGRLAAESGQRLETGYANLQKCLAATPPPGLPHHAAVHWRMGNILEKKGDKAAARAAYETAVRTDPNFKLASDSLKKLQ